MKQTTKVYAIAAALALASGCAQMPENETAGTIIGGVAGAVAGSHFGKGSGKNAMTAVGAVIGASAGSQIGRAMDATSKELQNTTMENALERGEVGSTIQWDNPENEGGSAHGSTRVTRTGSNADGRPCREFHQEVWIGGEKEQMYGTACKDRAGAWKIIDI